MLIAFATLLGTGACFAQDTLWTRFLDMGAYSEVVVNSVRCQGNDVYLGGVAATESGPDAFVARYSSDGDSLWFVSGVVDTIEAGLAIAVGPDASPYLWMNAGDPSDGVLVKFNGSGDTLWTRRFPGLPQAAIAADTANNCYIYAAVGSGDSLWLGRYDTLGSQTLGKTFSFGPSHDRGQVCTTTDGNVVVSLSVLDSSEVTGTLVKFSSSGDTLWTRQYPQNVARFFVALAAGPENTVHAVALETGGVKLAKFQSNGNLSWVAQLTQTSLAFDVAVDDFGNIFLTYGEDDGFFLDKYLNGELLGTAEAGTPDIDIPFSLDICADGEVVVGGISVIDSTGTIRGYLVKFNGPAGLMSEPDRARPDSPWRLLGTVTDGNRLNWQIDQPGECRFSVFDAAGRYVCGSRAEVATGRYSLALPELACGVYLVRVDAESAAYTHKFVVQK